MLTISLTYVIKSSIRRPMSLIQWLQTSGLSRRWIELLSRHLPYHDIWLSRLRVKYISRYLIHLICIVR